MPSVIIIDKSCNIKASVITKFSEEDLFKKAGFKSPNGFSKYASWNLTITNEQYVIELYGKTTGRAGQENKYEFPPPADNILFFGTCLLVCKKKTTNVAVDITVEQWNAVYEGLHGGFEDIDGTSSEDSREEETKIPISQKTKAGYVKDDFVVDDDSGVDTAMSSQTDTDEEYEIENTKKQKAKRVSPTKKTPVVKRVRRKEQNVSQIVEKEIVTQEKLVDTNATKETTKETTKENTKETTKEEENYLGCTKELCEEEYLPDI